MSCTTTVLLGGCLAAALEVDLFVSAKSRVSLLKNVGQTLTCDKVYVHRRELLESSAEVG